MTYPFSQYEVMATIKHDPLVKWVKNTHPGRSVSYRFATHSHAYVDELIERLNTLGLPGLLDADYQAGLTQALTPDLYTLGPNVELPFPESRVEVSDHGAYSTYNWELLFHAPVLIATHLSKNQRYEEAQRWFHFVFDPTSNDLSVPVPQRFWRFLRFREETTPDRIAVALRQLAEGTDPDLVARLNGAIEAWRDQPFQPHVIARTRAVAYQTNVVMKYLDNLLAWGDSLFRQDTVEAMNEATQVYVLAAQLLGPKPQPVPPRGTAAPKTYAQLKDAGLDEFGNALVELENDFPFDSYASADRAADPGVGAAFGVARSLYFCIPANEQLLTYWDQVADRLFKLRHCMNIEGVFRIPALFDPALDPGAMVRAAAAGIDIASVLDDVGQPVSIVRGPVLLQKAQEICGQLTALGASMLGAIEKAEGERLATTRLDHEITIATLTADLKFLQWKEAEGATEALLKTRAVTFERYRHYKRILGNDEGQLDKLASVDLVRGELTAETFDAVYAELVTTYGGALPREQYRKETSVGGLMEFAGNAVTGVMGGQLGTTLPLNKNEHAELNIFLPTADTFDAASTLMKVAAPLLALVPQFGAAAKPMGVGAEVGFGGVQLAAAARGGAELADKVAGAFKSSAERASRLGGYYRRAEDYVLQANLATRELEQLGRQVIGCLLREHVARHEYELQQRQLANSIEVKDFYSERFASEDLYTWMHGRLSEAHYDCYKLAFDIARKAERTLQHEVMRPEFDEQSFVKFAYWDGGRRGLTSGDTLAVDLRRLEVAYLEQNRREFEMTRHVSIARLDPNALLQLKATGSCEIELPEWLYDLDCPGQYFRRIKSVSVSIPCVVGPYTGVHCKLSLLRSSIRTSALVSDGYARRLDGDDDRFRDLVGAIESIVTSSGQNDSGLFDPNARDDRRLPFEGAGAISTWRLELPVEVPTFDITSISDIVLHVRYTAREAGALRRPAIDDLEEEVLAGPEVLAQMFSLPHEFGDRWRTFVTAPAATRRLDISIDRARFPYWLRAVDPDTELRATFAVIDSKKHKLSLAPKAAVLTGDAGGGSWRLSIRADGDADAAAVAAFLARHQDENIYMTVSGGD